MTKELAIVIVRNNWRTTGGRLLSLGDLNNPFREAFKRAHAPSVLRAIDYNGMYDEAREARTQVAKLGQECFEELYNTNNLGRDYYNKKIYGDGGAVGFGSKNIP